MSSIMRRANQTLLRRWGQSHVINQPQNFNRKEWSPGSLIFSSSKTDGRREASSPFTQCKSRCTRNAWRDRAQHTRSRVSVTLPLPCGPSIQGSSPRSGTAIVTPCRAVNSTSRRGSRAKSYVLQCDK
ncbi:hypothetical protein CBL_00273 [Carabus blaptoides fortunei]